MAVNEIRYKGVTYATDQDIWASSGELYETKALKCDSLEANTLSVTVSDSDRSIMTFKKNDKVEYWRDGKLMGIFYLQSVERVGPEAYTLYALSAVGLLMTRSHPGGIYTGETAGDVIRSICGSVPVLVESVYKDRKLYGWLPYVQPPAASARDNLAEVLFALGAFLGVDRNGVLRVEKLWGGYSCTIGPDRIYADNCSVKVTDPVSSVEVTEHQWVKSTDEVTLFDGTATAGTLVTFSDPAYDLVGDGVTVLESGANYAVLSAGTGTLKGKSYNHLTRTVSRVVTEDAEENIVTIQDAHLVSITNSADVSRRLAQYYRHRETIQVDTNPHAGPPGAVVQMWHPWDNQYVQATVAQRDTSISGLLKSGTDALVGFTPPQPETADYYDTRVILTGSGEWEIPVGVISYTRVLIGGGDGGWSGLRGSNAPLPDVINRTESDSDRRIRIAVIPYSEGGAGGEPGAPGAGGKVLVETVLDAVPGTKITYSCGKGGAGGVYSADGSVQGAVGGATTMGGSSSDDGSSSDAGYVDAGTGQVFATPGANGIAGSKGHGYSSVNDNYVDNPSPEIVVDGVAYTPGEDNDTSDEGGRGTWTSEPYGRVAWEWTGGLGGGAAYKANGSKGSANGWGAATSSSASATGSSGGRGATALPPPKADAQYGKGGAGGNGGGGAGSNGVAMARQIIKSGVSASNAKLTVTHPATGYGGAGSNGGEGADGCIILFLHSTTTIKTGPLVEANHKWLLDSLGRWLIV